MGTASTISLSEKTASASEMPKNIGNSIEPSIDLNSKVVVTFIDEFWLSNKPSLEYYRQLYKSSGYSDAAIDSLIIGLSHSSLYES